MTTWFVSLLISSLSMSLIALGYMALTPSLAKKYSPKSLYAIWLVLLIGFLVPLRPAFSHSLFTIEKESLNQVVILPHNEKNKLDQVSLSHLPLEEPPILSQEEKLETSSIQPTAFFFKEEKMPEKVSQEQPPLSVALPPSTNTSLSEVLPHPTEIPLSSYQKDSPSPKTFQLLSLLTFLWLLGAGIFLLWHSISHFSFIKKVNRWKEPLLSGETFQLFLQLKKEMGIAKNISLYHCPAITSPMLIGFVKPAILLPAQALSAPRGEVHYIIKHELVHFKQKDLWVKALMLFTTSLHWYNPLIYLFINQMTFWCELSCDAQTVKNTSIAQRSDYCEAILSIARSHNHQYSALSTPFIGGKKNMKKRIFSILDTKPKKIGFSVLLLTLILTLSTGFFLSVKGSNNQKEPLPVITKGFTENQLTTSDTTFITAPTLAKSTFYGLTDQGNLYAWSTMEDDLSLFSQVSVPDYFLPTDDKGIAVTDLLTMYPAQREVWGFNSATGNVGKIDEKGIQWEENPLEAFTNGDYIYRQGYLTPHNFYALCQKNSTEEEVYILVHSSYLGDLEKTYNAPGVIGLYPYKNKQLLLLQEAGHLTPLILEEEHSSDNVQPSLILSVFNMDTGEITPFKNNIAYSFPEKNTPIPADGFFSIGSVAYDIQRDIIYYTHHQTLFASIKEEPFAPIGTIDQKNSPLLLPRLPGWVLPKGAFAYLSQNDFSSQIPFISTINPPTMEEEILPLNPQAMVYNGFPLSDDYFIYLYDEPDETAKKLMKYYNSAPVTILETVNDTWVKVRVGGIKEGYLEGYVMEELLAIPLGKTHYPVQSSQDEYLTKVSTPVYTKKYTSSSSFALTPHTPFSVIGREGSWWHIRVAPVHQSIHGFRRNLNTTPSLNDDSSDFYSYMWPTPEAIEEGLITGFIYSDNPTSMFTSFSRVIVNSPSLYAPFTFTDSLEKEGVLDLVNGTEVFILSRSHYVTPPFNQEVEEVEVCLVMKNGLLKGTMAPTDLLYRYKPSDLPAATSVVSLKNDAKKDFATLYHHFTLSKPLVTTFPNGTKAQIVGKVQKHNAYLVEVEDSYYFSSSEKLGLSLSNNQNLDNVFEKGFTLENYQALRGNNLTSLYSSSLQSLGIDEVNYIFNHYKHPFHPSEYFTSFLGTPPNNYFVPSDEIFNLVHNYQPLGVTQLEESQEYLYQGQKVRFLLDSLHSPIAEGSLDWAQNISQNPIPLESLYYNPFGEVDLIALRDYSQLNEQGVGLLTGFTLMEEPFKKNTPSPKNTSSSSTPSSTTIGEQTAPLRKSPLSFDGQEYITTRALPLYTSPEENSLTDTIPLHTPIQVLDHKDNFWYIRYASTEQPYLNSPKSNSPKTITGFITSLDKDNFLRPVYRKVIDYGRGEYPSLTPSLFPSATASSPSGYLLHGVEVFSLRQTAESWSLGINLTEIVVCVGNTSFMASMDQHYLRDAPIHSPPLIPLSFSPSKNPVLELDPYSLGSQSSLLSHDSQGVVFGKIHYPQPMYMVQVNGLTGFISPEYLAFPEELFLPSDFSEGLFFPPEYKNTSTTVPIYFHDELMSRYNATYGKDLENNLYPLINVEKEDFSTVVRIRGNYGNTLELCHVLFPKESTDSYQNLYLNSIVEDYKYQGISSQVHSYSQLVFEDEKIRFFFDKPYSVAAIQSLLSKGPLKEPLILQKVYFNPFGTVNISAIRDYEQANERGIGKLIGASKDEFDHNFWPLDESSTPSLHQPKEEGPIPQLLYRQESIWFSIIPSSNLSQSHFLGAQGEFLPSNQFSPLGNLRRVAYLPKETKGADTSTYPLLERRDYNPGQLSEDELKNHFSQYEPLGLTYDFSTATFTYQGEAVAQWIDFLRSPLTQDTVWIDQLPKDAAIALYETYYNPTGAITLYMIRDYTDLDEKGIGKLIGLSTAPPNEIAIPFFNNYNKYGFFYDSTLNQVYFSLNINEEMTKQTYLNWLNNTSLPVEENLFNSPVTLGKKVELVIKKYAKQGISLTYDEENNRIYLDEALISPLMNLLPIP